MIIINMLLLTSVPIVAFCILHSIESVNHLFTRPHAHLPEKVKVKQKRLHQFISFKSVPNQGDGG